MINQLKKELKEKSNSKQAKILQRFFKTGKGEYGEGDIFLGIKVPIQRSIAKKYTNLPLNQLQNLLDSKVHEYRLIALVILMDKYKKENKEKIYNFYIKNLKNINNWDLVDISCPNIIGAYLYTQPRDVTKKTLQKLAISDNLWERRVAIVSTFYFIRQNRFGESIGIAQMLKNDKHDLIHKAIGWMLREIGKRNQEVEERFLRKYYKTMPRTMLRSAIERFSKEKKEFYMKK